MPDTELPDTELHSPARKRAPSFLTPLLFQIVVMVGVALLVYPQAADWFAGFGQRATIAAYVQSVNDMPSPDRTSALQAARQYNGTIPAGRLRDPFTSDGSDDTKTAGFKDYAKLLNPNGDGIMGTLIYPNANIDLPIYHGTDDAVMVHGIGHLYGSSLPVGGPSTHAVLTSHSGLIDAKLFTNLVGAASIGDIFHISVLGEDLYYQVDDIETVLPAQTDSLSITPGKDYVTLVTCTPIGVNSHRLLVRGVRIPPPVQPAVDSGPEVLAGQPTSAGFPWWALWLTAALAGTSYLYVPLRRRGRKEHTS